MFDKTMSHTSKTIATISLYENLVISSHPDIVHLAVRQGNNTIYIDMNDIEDVINALTEANNAYNS